MNIKCPYVYVECTTISGEPNCKGCPNFNLTPIEKEEWVDCTREFNGMHLQPSEELAGYYCLVTGSIYKLGELRILATRSNGSAEIRFRIERRVVKKVCKECGREI
jgi:hypothetical protein